MKLKIILNQVVIMASQLPADKLIEVLSCQWAGNQEIMKIIGCGSNTAIKVRKEIEQSIKEVYPNVRLPSKKVPMEELIKYFNIDLKRLEKMAILNKKIK